MLSYSRLKLAARLAHANYRAKSRVPGVSAEFLDKLQNIVAEASIPQGDYYLRIPHDATPGTNKGYVALKSTLNKVRLATVLGPTMAPFGKDLALVIDNRRKARIRLLETSQGLAIKEYAPGIPDRNTIKRIPTVTSRTDWEFVVHEHNADKAGLHYDLRLADPQGNAHSWALRYWPKVSGEKRLATQQPTHTKQYMKFQGDIVDGYGKGRVRIWKHGKAEITAADDNKVSFHLYEGRNIYEFALVRTDGKRWLLINKSASKQRFDIPHDKPKMDSVDIDDRSKVINDANYIMTSKIDGAHSIITLQPSQSKPIRVFSYRRPKGERELIEYTHKMPWLFNEKVPSKFDKTMLRGEVWASNSSGAPLHSSRVSGILNANTRKSRDLQKDHGRLRISVFDVIMYRGQRADDLPYSKKLEILSELVDAVPSFSLPALARSAEEKKSLLAAVKNSPLHETSEGVILHHKEQSRALKAKIRPDYDVYVRGVFAATDTNGRKLDRAGGFTYSWSRSGPIVGRVGTGFSHAELKDMLAHPSKYLGRVAQVQARTKYPSGALGEPSFMRWHIDKNIT